MDSDLLYSKISWSHNEMGKNDPQYRCVSRVAMLACSSENLHFTDLNWSLRWTSLFLQAGTRKYVPGWHLHIWIRPSLMNFILTCRSIPDKDNIISNCPWRYYNTGGNINVLVLLRSFCFVHYVLQPSWLFTVLIMKPVLLSSSHCQNTCC